MPMRKCIGEGSPEVFPPQLPLLSLSHDQVIAQISKRSSLPTGTLETCCSTPP